MNDSHLPVTRDIVLIGGGHTHALVLRRWGMKPLPGARLTLINPGPTAPYSGMLPGHVAGHYPREALDIDLVRLARFAGARLILGAAGALDPVAREVHVPGRPPVGYDLCSVDVGITSDMPGLPGFAEHAAPAKPLGPFAEAWRRYLGGTGAASVAVIGGGVAGVELAMAMAHALNAGGRPSEVTVIDNATALSALGGAAQRKLRAAMKGLGVQLVERTGVSAIESGFVLLEDGRRIEAGFVTGTAGARPYEWLAASGLAATDGFLDVSPTLQTSDPAVFATGDCAHMTFAPRPKAGVYAVRQAPVLFDNLRAVAMGKPLKRYKPQDDYLKLISLGSKAALAEKYGVTPAGPAMWRLKDRIDQAFMEKFRALPAMPVPKLPEEVALGVAEALGDKPLCGGCGSKVGRGTLRLSATVGQDQGRDDIVALPGDDAALIRMGEHRQVISTDHLRAFTEDPVVLTRIAAVHALGDIWAMGARPQAATATLILPRLSAELQARTLREITQTARTVLGEAGAALVGGHTTLGAELTVGFTVTGLCGDEPITLAGAQPGDALILTKPIGSGVIMAAEMAGAARGEWVAAALDFMAQGQGAASRVLAGAHAMTDVTGFGLAGHLAGICEASGVGAEIALDAVPLMAGAAELAGRGTRSTIFADNRALAPELPEGGVADLLFDPQTGGGLLAAVPKGEAEAIVAGLRAEGYGAATRIGRIVEGPAQLSVV